MISPCLGVVMSKAQVLKVMRSVYGEMICMFNPGKVFLRSVTGFLFNLGSNVTAI